MWRYRSSSIRICHAEDRFADFAELTADASQEDALYGLDRLFDRLEQDAVAYFIYVEWMEAAFYNPFSPCRNQALFSHAVDRIVTGGILMEDEYAPLLQRKEWMGFNLAGTPAVVPGVNLQGERTLVLVLDLSCPSCREALSAFDDPQWEGLRRVAVCCGHGPEPSVAHWEYIIPEHADAVFDRHMTPVYFVVSADGVVERTYTLIRQNEKD